MNDQIMSDYLKTKELYEIIRNREFGDDPTSVQGRLDIIRQLEFITGKQFRTSSEFHREVQAYIDNGGERLKSLGKRIRKARKAKKWTLKRLAAELGFKSHSAFILYEQEKRLPAREVMEWLLREEKKPKPNMSL
jgi:ribosome-binding protein aMBF1 (putative translation factor)